LRAAAQAALHDAPMIFTYVERCGPRLRAVLTGAEPALDTLFPGGSAALAESLYAEWAVSRYFGALMRSLLAAYIPTRGGAGLQVLEVGAGTGATTAALLPVLPPPRTVYEFTDVSDLFLTRAAGKFAAYDFVRYLRLDVEQDPHAQGFAAHAYDVIVATNVLHATVDLPAVLDRLAGLLAPGGLLLVNEATEHLAWFDITTGLIEGWQRFADELRQEQPLLGAEAWCAALLDHGFGEAAAWPHRDTPPAVLGQHVIAALRAPRPGAAGEPGTASPAFVAHLPAGPAHGQDTSPGEELPAGAEELRARLQAAVPDERRHLLLELVATGVRHVLRLEEAAPVDERARLLDLGLDSLMALELRRLLALSLGLEGDALSATLVFDYPTLGALAAYLGEHVPAAPLSNNGGAAPEAPAAQHPAPDLAEGRAAEVAAMSDAEVEALLMAKLSRRS
jgi:SAM-dependent methyltransferase/acyl carrier protein